MASPRRLVLVWAVLSIVAFGCVGGTATPAPSVGSSGQASLLPSSNASPTSLATSTPTLPPAPPPPTASHTLPPPPPPPTATPTPAPAMPVISGEYLLTQTGHGESIVIRPNGTGRRSLSYYSPVSWSSDGSTVHLQAWGCIPSLATVPVWGGPIKAIQAALKPLDKTFTWSPDGRKIAFLRYFDTPAPQCDWQNNPYTRAALMVMNSDGSNLHEVFRSLQDDTQIYWLPDNKTVAVNTSDGVNLVQGPIIRIDTVTGHKLAGAAGSCLIYSFAVSLDGKLVAWVCDDGVHVGEIAGQGDRLFAHPPHSGDGSPVWSPDNKALAWIRTGINNSTYVMIWRTPAANPTSLYVPLNYSFIGPKLTWSPDMKMVAAINPNGGVVTVYTNGLGPLQVPNSTDLLSVDWEP
jgi:hypothetical protein